MLLITDTLVLFFVKILRKGKHDKMVDIYILLVQKDILDNNIISGQTEKAVYWQDYTKNQQN